MVSSSAAISRISAAIATARVSRPWRRCTTGRPATRRTKKPRIAPYNWVSYWQGLAGAAHAPFSNQWWFTDQYADGPRRMMDAFWAVPEWAPAHESHLLGSISPVTKIAYGRGSVTYSTFDADSTDVLRLDFAPAAVRVGGRAIARVPELTREGYTFDEQTRVLRIHHTSSRDVDVQGSGGNTPPSLVTFDDPHEPAGTPLNGQYPSGVIDWGASQWRIATPIGKFGTFNTTLLDANATQAEFHFYAPRIFLGFDVYNDSDRETTIAVKPSGDHEEMSVVVRAKELKHVRADATTASASVAFRIEPGAAASLHFDNVAYAHP